jgi:hypothetical protein
VRPLPVLLPKLERLAQRYGARPDPRVRDGVVVAKIDCDANDVPDRDVRGFPWFKLYPAADKGWPATYAGQRRVEAWAAFVRAPGVVGRRAGLAASGAEWWCAWWQVDVWFHETGSAVRLSPWSAFGSPLLIIDLRSCCCC